VVIFSVQIILRNKNPVKTLTYIFALATLPFLGILIYIFFGQDYRKNKIFRKKYLLDNSKLRRWREEFKLSWEERKEFKEEFGDAIFKIYNLLRNNDRAVLSYDNDVRILVNGEEKFKELRKDLKNAHSHIHLEYFVIVDDVLGREIIKILCEKSVEGVDVRIVYDDVGSSISHKSKKELNKSGVELYPFMPVMFSNSTSKFNYRDHRKIVIIDGVIGYLGGINLEKKYDNTYNNLRYWRDTHIKLTGSAVGSLQLSFLLSWDFVSKKELGIDQKLFPLDQTPTLSPVAVQIAASGPDTDWASIMEALFAAINGAQDYVYITTPYLVPNDQIITALSTAARSGVDVRIIIPYKSDSFWAQYATDSYIEQLLKSEIKIYRYIKGFIHAKTMVIDDLFSTVGSANLDYRSFGINFEVNALLYSKQTALDLKDLFLMDLNSCEEVDLLRWQTRGIFRKIKESFSRLWGPLL